MNSKGQHSGDESKRAKSAARGLSWNLPWWIGTFMLLFPIVPPSIDDSGFERPGLGWVWFFGILFASVIAEQIWKFFKEV